MNPIGCLHRLLVSLAIIFGSGISIVLVIVIGYFTGKFLG